MDLITYGILKKKMEGVTEEVTEAKEAAQQAQAKAEQAQAKAKTSETNAKTSETNAAHSATEAAETVENLNTQFQNAMSALTVDSEVQNIRVGEDGTTYPSAGEAVRGQIAELKSQLETKAEIDGYYQDMTVGDAEQMISTQYVEDTEPYLYRTTGGTSDVGNREYVRKIVGGTLAWNQYVRISASSRSETKNNVTCTDNRNGSYTIQTTAEGASADSSFNVVSSNESPVVKPGHVFLKTGAKISAGIIVSDSYAGWSITLRDEQLFKRTSDASTKTSVALKVNSGTIITTPVTVWPMIFDLTAMFGSTIADHIYQLEQTTAGAGVAFFRKLFPAEYYPYDAGTLKSVEGLTAHEMVGFNQWDEEWELGGFNSAGDLNNNLTNRIRSKNFIHLLPNTTYFFNNGNSAFNKMMVFYDVDKNFISVQYGNGLFVTPANAHYAKFSSTNDIYGPTYKNDICINLAWSGTRNGEYEPYIKHSYALDDSITLRGIPKLSDDGKLMYDGDRYLPDGTVERRYGVVDLGTLTWTYRTDTAMPIFSARINDAKPVTSGNAVGSIICPKYTVATSNNVSQSGYDKTIAKAANVGYIYVQDSTYPDVDTFKAAISGVMLVYELATPTTETATPYPEVQLCDDWGTERFVTDSIVPVGTETDYPANLRDKLQHLPDLASADGYYAIKQVGTQMTLEPFRIPKAPTTDGTYALRATVSGGVPTYTWEQEVVVNASEEA